jgi:hypothetical protein
MKRLLIPLALVIPLALLAATISAPALSADVGVAITIGHPGFYGLIEMSGYERPPLLYSRPITIQRVRRGPAVQPIYLNVPRNHAKNWRRYCGRYQACNRPVYFVRNDWYSNVYAPQYREQHRNDRRDERHDRDDRNDDRRDDRHDREHNDHGIERK